MGALADDVIDQWNFGSAEKQTHMTQWQIACNYVLPNRSDYLVEKTPGQKRMTYIYDAFPVWACEQMASGIHSLTASNSVQWFQLRADDDATDQDPDVRLWLEQASRVMYNVFNSPKLNFASQSFELFLDQASIGCATMAVLDSPTTGLPLFSTRHMKECVWFENEEDRIDGLIREWDWTAKQATQRWGNDAGEKAVKAMADGKPTTKIKYLHAARPRKKRDMQRADARNMPWESVYVEVDGRREISVSGFNEFPYLCPRFSKVSSETYGRGPTQVALPDVQMLNEANKLVVKAAQKVIDPPLQVPDDGFLMGIRTVPGSFNYYRSNSTGRVEPIKTGGDIQLGMDYINMKQNQIGKTYYVDMLRMPIDPNDPASEGKGITATYWLQRQQKEMLMLGPMLSRQRSELFGPLIDRVFAMLWRLSKARRFGPGSSFTMPPPLLSRAKLNVEYVSPMELAQKASVMDGLQRLMQLQGELKQMDPDSPMILNGDEAMRLTGRTSYAPVTLLKTKQQLQDEADQKAQAEAAAQNHEALANVAGAVKDGSTAVKNIASLQNGGQDMRQAA